MMLSMSLMSPKKSKTQQKPQCTFQAVISLFSHLFFNRRQKRYDVLPFHVVRRALGRLGSPGRTQKNRPLRVRARKRPRAHEDRGGQYGRFLESRFEWRVQGPCTGKLTKGTLFVRDPIEYAWVWHGVFKNQLKQKSWERQPGKST